MLSDNIMTLRKHKNMSQDILADMVGVSRQTLSKWETGESLPDVEKAAKLAEIFGVSLDDLMSYDSGSTQFPVPPRGKHMFGVVTIGDKGQIVIPAKARKIFNLSPGDNLIVLGDENSGIALMKERDLMEMMRLAALGGEK